MNNQDALFPIIKEDITFDTLLTQAKQIIEQQSSQNWSYIGESDPGITLLEACCYGISDLAYRHSLPLKDLLTLEKKEQLPYDGIFPTEFGPQKMLTCGPITAEDYRKALLDLHSHDNLNDSINKNSMDTESSTGYFLFNDVQLIREPEKERYQYWYNKKEREYSFTSTKDSEQLTLRGNYWLYLVPSRETEINKTLTQKSLDTFLKNNRNICEYINKIIWLKPTDLILQIDIEIDDDVNDIANIIAQVYRIAEQLVLEKPERYTTQTLQEQGYSNEEIFSGPNLKHGWIAKLPPTKNYADSTKLHLNHLVNQLLTIKGIRHITRLALAIDEKNSPISSLQDDNWSWKIAQGYYPRLWGANPLELITSSETPLKITTKGGVTVTASQQQVKEKNIPLPLINTEPVLINWGKNRKTLDYYSVSNKLPDCYGLQSNAKKTHQEQLQKFMLPFEQMLANSCAELNLLPNLLAFKQRGNKVYGTQWPFNSDQFNNQNIHQNIKYDLIKKLNHDVEIENDNGINQKNYTKELTILNYLLGYFGAQCSINPLISEQKEYLSIQRGYLAQQPQLAYQRSNIRIDKVSALQKRIAARIGLGEECFSKTPNLAKLPFYLIEHRQLLPIKPDKKFDTEQKPDALEITNDQLKITQQDTTGRLLQGQIINLIIIENDNRKIKIMGQIITKVTENTFYLNAQNSKDLKSKLKKVQEAFKKGTLRWQNSPVWLKDIDYELFYSNEDNQKIAKDERWITLAPQIPFPAMIKENDEITLEYKTTPSDKRKSLNSDSQETVPEPLKLKAHIIQFNRIKRKILIRLDNNSPGVFPIPGKTSHYYWYFSNPEYAVTDRFSFVVSAVFNNQLFNNKKFTIDPYKLDDWIKNEILSEFPAHISIIMHWLSPENFESFANTYKLWQNNGIPLGDEAYQILEMLTLGHLPYTENGIGHMTVATPDQRIKVIGQSGNEWHHEFIENEQLFYVPKD
ncbi:hypothetical protein [Xenorhabdus ishibashii]|uniref:Uncharacterized protein n=1 Tax=Xenorhabdus ishibashii TaxID=1034471 RepID=A0A2D0KA82_9GAMM|nr:hypothetical protein [Xenorhabdus ishibashii]PHM60369.1 hypothetical protein Xish_03516 [Xenorhabdus ishibashii]